MKKLLVIVFICWISCYANAYINSPMNLIYNSIDQTVGIELLEGMSSDVDGLSGGYWALIGVEPVSGTLTQPSVLDLSNIYGDAGQTNIFISGIGVVGEFTASTTSSWTAAAGIYAEDFILLEGWHNLYLFQLNDAGTEATWIPGAGSLDPPPSWIFVPEPATIALLCLGGMMIRHRK